ncbi:MAG: hypothetical protein AB8G95_03905 [Anaerolineae bacterium]
MKKYLLGSVFISLCSLSLLIQWQASATGGWVSNTTHAPYRIDQVCQDGVQVSIVNVTRGDINNLNQDNTVRILPPLVFDGDIADAWSFRPGEADPPLAKEYFNPIGASKRITVTAADLKVDPVEYQGNDEYYHTTIVIPFFQKATTGKTVAVGNSGALFELNSNHQHLVEDCQFFEYAADTAQTIPQAAVAADYTGFDTDKIVFEVIQLPESGTLAVNDGSPLSLNTQFTLDDLSAGIAVLNYEPTSFTAKDSSFTLKVSGTKRVSLNSEGEQLNAASSSPTISADGRYIAFSSTATNTKSDGAGGFINTNNVAQVYKFDLPFNQSNPVSYSFSDAFADEIASWPDISPDGSGVAFSSTASNLLDNAPSYCFGSTLDDTNNVQDIFFSINSGIYRPSMFRFNDPTNNFNCEQLNSVSILPATADTRAIRPGTNYSSGRHVVFQTLEPIDAPEFTDTNGSYDILLFSDSYTEWVAGAAKPLQIVPVPTSQPPFAVPRSESESEESAGVEATGAPLATDAPNGRSTRADISADANVIVFETGATDLIKSVLGIDLDTNGQTDIYAGSWNGNGWAISRISVTSDQAQAVGGGSVQATVSQFGNHIAFTSNATNFDPAAVGTFFQIFVRDRQAGCTTLISTDNDGFAGNETSQQPSISANGRFIAFQSAASNLIDSDVNGVSDIFVVDRDSDGDGQFYSDVDSCTPGPRNIIRVSVAADGTPANDSSSSPDISLNGEFVTFQSSATNLVSDDTNGVTDIFLRYIGYERTIELKGGLARLYLPLAISE